MSPHTQPRRSIAPLPSPTTRPGPLRDTPDGATPPHPPRPHHAMPRQKTRERRAAEEAEAAGQQGVIPMRMGWRCERTCGVRVDTDISRACAPRSSQVRATARTKLTRVARLRSPGVAAPGRASTRGARQLTTCSRRCQPRRARSAIRRSGECSSSCIHRRLSNFYVTSARQRRAAARAARPWAPL